MITRILAIRCPADGVRLAAGDDDVGPAAGDGVGPAAGDDGDGPVAGDDGFRPAAGDDGDDRDGDDGEAVLPLPTSPEGWAEPHPTASRQQARPPVRARRPVDLVSRRIPRA
jgi:hypothetical protein